MMNNKHNVFNYIQVGFIAICALFVGFFTYQYNIEKAEVIEEIHKSADVVVKGIEGQLQSTDKLYLGLELYADTFLKDAIEEMNQAYKAGILNNEKLEEIKSRYEHVELFVISEDNVIIQSTDPDVYLLDFNIYEEFTDFLTTVREKKVYVSERVDISLNDDEVIKFSYFPTEDGKIILEAGYKMSAFDKLLKSHTFNDLSSELYTYNNFVVDLCLYEYYNDMDSRMFKIQSPDEAELMDALNTVYKTKQTVSYSIIVDGYTETTVLIPYVIGHINEADSVFIYRLIYSDRAILTEFDNDYMALAVVFVFVILVFIVLSYSYNKKTFVPLQRLLEAFEEVRNKNFKVRVESSGVDVVHEALETFNEMVESIDQLIMDKDAIEEALKNHLIKSEDGYLNTVTAMANAIEAKDDYTGGHCERVMNMSILVSEYINMDDDEVKQLMYASLLHDIGKIGVSDNILNKKGQYTDQEYVIMKQHPEIGYNIISGIDFLSVSNEAILYHHERIDGKGYPSGLKGEEIPVLAKLLCITDAFDAMTSRRVYRKSVMTVREAFEELERCSGTHFDFELVYQFKKAYENAYGLDLSHYADEIE